MTAFQERCCAAIKKAPNGVLSTAKIAHAVDSSFVAVVSAMNSLERSGAAKSFRAPTGDQWAPLMWCLPSATQRTVKP